MTPTTTQTTQASSGPARPGARRVLGDATAWAIDDDRLVAAARTTFQRWSCPIPTPSGGGHAPTANRSSELQGTHFTLAPDYRSLSKYEGRLCSFEFSYWVSPLLTAAQAARKTGHYQFLGQILAVPNEAGKILVAPKTGRAPVATWQTHFGHHSRASFCASEIWAGVMSFAISSRASFAMSWPLPGG